MLLPPLGGHKPLTREPRRTPDPEGNTTAQQVAVIRNHKRSTVLRSSRMAARTITKAMVAGTTITIVKKVEAENLGSASTLTNLYPDPWAARTGFFP